MLRDVYIAAPREGNQEVISFMSGGNKSLLWRKNAANCSDHKKLKQGFSIVQYIEFMAKPEFLQELQETGLSEYAV